MKAFVVLYVKTKLGMIISINILDLHTLHLVEQILSSYTSVNVYILVVRLGPFRTAISCNVRYIFLFCHASVLVVPSNVILKFWYNNTLKKMKVIQKFILHSWEKGELCIFPLQLTVRNKDIRFFLLLRTLCLKDFVHAESHYCKSVD